jgi:hypothetical protein
VYVAQETEVGDAHDPMQLTLPALMSGLVTLAVTLSPVTDTSELQITQQAGNQLLLEPAGSVAPKLCQLQTISYA